MKVCKPLILSCNINRFFFYYKIFVDNEKMSDLFHHIYPSKWANCSKNHQQQATKNISITRTVLLVWIIRKYLGMHYTTGVLSDIYLFSSSNQKFCIKWVTKINSFFFSFLWLRLVAASLDECKMNIYQISNHINI